MAQSCQPPRALAILPAVETLEPNLASKLQELVVSTQGQRRLPSLVLVVQRQGVALGTFAVGQADVQAGLAAGPDVQYRLGSITKTVTAVAVMRLVHQGRLALTDQIGRHWPDAPHPDLEVAALLAHTSGLQREPVGEVWESLALPSRDELGGNAAAARRLYPSGSWWHYSNLGYALLGELVAQVAGESWEAHARHHILEPLGMIHTSLEPEPPSARGYAVAPYSDDLIEEPPLDTAGIAPAAQLWSTASDLAIWSDFLNRGHADVLSHDQLQEMRELRVMADLEGWRLGWGLGLMLLRRGERVYSGHTGSMPGFLAACFGSPERGLGVALLTNATGSVRIGEIAAQALDILQEAGGSVPWVPGPAVPESVRPLLGRWWTEWNELVFSWREGRLVSMAADAPDGAPADLYEEVEPDLYLCASGQERGEELRVVRDSQGGVLKMYRATYPLTREPKPFGALGGVGPQAG
jgi:CubicO group peptidase (beta-lactamase class C family)